MRLFDPCGRGLGCILCRMRKLLLIALALSPLLLAQEVIDRDANWKIRREANEHSQVMRTAHVLTDRYGPRLTGSPNYEAAAKWAVAQLTEWGLKNAHLEPWDFGHPGWLNERASGLMTAPVARNLHFEVLAWTPSTNGAAAGLAVQLVPPQQPTKEELIAWLDANASKVRGRIVLIGKAAVIPVTFNPAAKRTEDSEARARYDPANPAPAGGPPRQAGAAAPRREGALPANDVTRMIDEWLVANGALVRVNDSGMGYGHIRAFQNRTYDIAKAVPTVVLRNEDFGRIERLLADGENVRLEFNIVNRTFPEGKTSYNVVAEIPGTDKADEVVMLGGHLDSWHAATGATDDASGCAVMMEAVRMMQALGLKPRRTVRVALWAAEEQGLLGSQAYVKQHFGTFEEPKPDYSKLVAYFNVDSGTGRLRGASIFGPPEAAAVLREALAPFEDLGVMGAAATRTRSLGGTDSASFSVAGLAGVGLSQDPIEYFNDTWHTNLDTYERLIPADLVQASIVVTGAVWHVANREQPLPRFTKEQMPAPPKAPEAAKPAAPSK
jgi:carboxypeptidase Q